MPIQSNPVGTALSAAVNRVGFYPSPPHYSSALPAHEIYASDEDHQISIAPTGSGKTVSCIAEVLSHRAGTLVVTDIKGEITPVTLRQREKQGPVYIIDPFHHYTDQPHTFNPLDLAMRMQPHKSIATLAQWLTSVLYGPRQIKDDPFWDDSAKILLSGAMGRLLDICYGGERNLEALYKMMYVSDPIYQIATILDHEKDLNPFAHSRLAAFLSIDADRTRSCVLSTAQTNIGFLGDETVQKATAQTTLDLDAIQRGDTLTVYIIFPPQYLNSHAPLARLYVDCFIQLMMERREIPRPASKIIIDECAQFQLQETLRTVFTLLRGYGLSIHAIYQDLSQLKRQFSDYETILNNCGVVRAFGCNTGLLARQTADIMGISPTEVAKLASDEQYVSMRGNVQRMKKLNYLTDSRFEGLYDPNPYYESSQQPKKHKTLAISNCTSSDT